MTDQTAEERAQLDEWRWEQAKAEAAGSAHGSSEGAIADAAYIYRRLVREDVRPPAEPDQDTLDTHNLIVTWTDGSNDCSFDEVKAALIQIKDRVRREAIQALPDDETAELLDASGFGQPGSMTWRSHLAAIKKVYG